MPFSIIRQDITKMNVDAIVNAANTELKMGGGVCGAIFKAAGAGQLQSACDPLAPIRTGAAVITPGFRLPAKYIIHTAGPVYQDGAHNEAILLGDCYRNSLKLALDYNCESIAFPLISTGIYGFPKSEALQVAMEAIEAFLSDSEMDVYLAVFDKEALLISEELIGDVTSYIDENYAQAHTDKRRTGRSLNRQSDFQEISAYLTRGEILSTPSTGLEDLIGNLDEPFSITLLRLIDAKGLTDVEVYKRANLDRKLFSKIRTNHGYMPGLRTALALCIALELDLEETDDLLERAGLTLSHARKFDVIVEYFILNQKYDVFAINEMLFKFDQPLLGV